MSTDEYKNFMLKFIRLFIESVSKMAACYFRSYHFHFHREPIRRTITWHEEAHSHPESHHLHPLFPYYIYPSPLRTTDNLPLPMLFNVLVHSYSHAPSLHKHWTIHVSGARGRQRFNKDCICDLCFKREVGIQLQRK